MTLRIVSTYRHFRIVQATKTTTTSSIDFATMAEDAGSTPTQDTDRDPATCGTLQNDSNNKYVVSAALETCRQSELISCQKFLHPQDHV